ncbi:hypothetical protein HID58_021693 [Brassica napus]|uniref:Uncharacterized protein n=1 Tax=Brassica napus TaxID=3708 RepID=A0ABQ8CX32_BRANA|nr:hypothetical protein HID58_021693 [Brassica napus]
MAQKRRIGLARNKCCSLNVTCCRFRFSTKVRDKARRDIRDRTDRFRSHVVEHTSVDTIYVNVKKLQNFPWTPYLPPPSPPHVFHLIFTSTTTTSTNTASTTTSSSSHLPPPYPHPPQQHPQPRHPPPHPPPHVFHLRINIHHHSIHHHGIHNHHQLFILTSSTSVSTSTTTASTTTSSSRVNQLVYLSGESISLSVGRGEGSISSRSGV